MPWWLQWSFYQIFTISILPKFVMMKSDDIEDVSDEDEDEDEDVESWKINSAVWVVSMCVCVCVCVMDFCCWNNDILSWSDKTSATNLLHRNDSSFLKVKNENPCHDPLNAAKCHHVWKASRWRTVAGMMLNFHTSYLSQSAVGVGTTKGMEHDRFFLLTFTVTDQGRSAEKAK